ncbi:hypothetical protein DFR72_10858 [Lentzea flaviverrucosa]|uniref:Uncharacterized protein n=2 Tax=Lentzea flaviverrucosa TaxID=200379 RepID=A0A1H9SIJ5_9PSEU|nr:hypothetical protein DFR72_10858 [Lentzea flaviverrucosa]SER84193.1 hypothetical protein SAMN05216195_10759 [Lentzea flaviverrucosa]
MGLAASPSEVEIGVVAEMVTPVELIVGAAVLDAFVSETGGAAVPGEEPHPPAFSANRTAPTAARASLTLLIFLLHNHVLSSKHQNRRCDSYVSPEKP